MCKEIRIVGELISENSDELEKGCVEVALSVNDILGAVDAEDIQDYVSWNLDMKHVDDFESSLDDFDEDELVEALENLNYDFYEKMDTDSCIEFIESQGYAVTADEDVVGNGLDCIDTQRLEDIQQKFIASSWDDKVIMYNKIFNL